jgi:hypothetical protein
MYTAHPRIRLFDLTRYPHSSECLSFLNAIQAVLIHCQPSHSSLLLTRLAKSILPSVTVVLASQSEIQRAEDLAGSTNASKNKKGKKRARGYEGDEVFKVTRDVICSTKEDGKVLIAALEGIFLDQCCVILALMFVDCNIWTVIRLVLRSPYLAPAVHSIASRVALSLLLVLPQTSPASLSVDLTLHGQVLTKVHEICAELGSGTTSTMSKSLGLIINAGVVGGSEHVSQHSFYRRTFGIHFNCRRWYQAKKYIGDWTYCYILECLPWFGPSPILSRFRCFVRKKVSTRPISARGWSLILWNLAPNC